MPHEMLPRTDRIALDLETARLLLSTECCITAEEWCEAQATGRAPPHILLPEGFVFARRPGGTPPRARWCRVSPRQAVAGEWTAPLGSGIGQECELVARWLVERDTRIPSAAEMYGSAPRQQPRDPSWTIGRSTADVRYVMDENAPKRGGVDRATMGVVAVAGGLGLLVYLILAVLS